MTDRLSLRALSEYLTPPEAAKLLRVDPATVICWIRSGELLASNLASRSARRPRYRISRQALDDFLAGRQVQVRPKIIRRKRNDARVIKFF